MTSFYILFSSSFGSASSVSSHSCKRQIGHHFCSSLQRSVSEENTLFWTADAGSTQPGGVCVHSCAERVRKLNRHWVVIIMHCPVAIYKITSMFCHILHCNLSRDCECHPLTNITVCKASELRIQSLSTLLGTPVHLLMWCDYLISQLCGSSARHKIIQIRIRSMS